MAHTNHPSLLEFRDYSAVDYTATAHLTTLYKHTLTAIGFTGDVTCYLDLDTSVAVDTYQIEGNRDMTGIPITVLGFNTVFESYSVRNSSGDS